MSNWTSNSVPLELHFYLYSNLSSAQNILFDSLTAICDELQVEIKYENISDFIKMLGAKIQKSMCGLSFISGFIFAMFGLFPIQYF